MRVQKLQVKTEEGWLSRRKLLLDEREELSLITNRGNKLIENDVEQGRTGFCHRRFKANIVLDIAEGPNLGAIKPGDKMLGTETAFIIQRIGKNCHSNCPIFTKTGCAFLEEILFLQVQKPGELKLMETLDYNEKDRENKITE